MNCEAVFINKSSNFDDVSLKCSFMDCIYFIVNVSITKHPHYKTIAKLRQYRAPITLWNFSWSMNFATPSSA